MYSLPFFVRCGSAPHPPGRRCVPAWRQRREVSGELALDVLEYAGAMTETRSTVTDELAAADQRLGEPAFVELASTAAVENLRSPMNSAFGLVGQDFSDRCAVPSGP